jgi:hypothetical protein
MNIWTLFIILNMTANPVTLDTTPHGPFDVRVHPSDGDKAELIQEDTPSLHLEVSPGKHWDIGSMIGVQANTTVSAPASAQLHFDSEINCATAQAIVSKQFGVASATCVESWEKP